MKKNIKMLLLLALVWSPLSVAQLGDTNTYIKSMDGVKEVPLSFLTNERSEGSLIYKTYKKESPLDIPRSRKKAHYFPIAGTSLDSIIYFLQYGKLSFELSDSECLYDDIKACQLFEMKSLFKAEIKERKLQEEYPELKVLIYRSPEIYQQIMLSLAAFDNNLNFFKYMMSKYHVKDKVLLENFSASYVKKLSMKVFPLTHENFIQYKLLPAVASIFQIVTVVDTDRKEILPYLLQQGVVTEEEIFRMASKISKINKISRRSRFQTLDEEKYQYEYQGKSESGKRVYKKNIYRKIINNPILGKNAWLDVGTGLAWSSPSKKKMTFSEAIKYCEEGFVTDLNSGLECRLPNEIEFYGINNLRAIWSRFYPWDDFYWASNSKAIIEKSYIIAYCSVFYADSEYEQHRVRCVCSYVGEEKY